MAGMPANGPDAVTMFPRSALAVWAGATAVLALIDHESLVVPTEIARGAILATLGLLVMGGIAAADWRHLWQSAFCTCLGAACFGAWAAVNPRGLGFGDVRMAMLVAAGAGAISVPGTVTALACSPLVAGLVGRYRAAPGHDDAREVALGPYLAVGGLTVVMAHAH
jgi:leader peptidase (prepilin peptidase)/N-methyltransferase